MSASRERAVGGVTSGEIGAGQTVTWQARHFGVPLRLTSRITAHYRPHRFVDEQIRGPFSRWRHEHRFEEVGGETLMTDRIEYDAPLGALGRLAERLILDRYMRRLIERRNLWLKQALESAPSGD